MFNSLTDEERQEVREVLEDKPTDEQQPQEVEQKSEVVDEEKVELGETENIEEGKDMPNEKENIEQDKKEEKTAETEKVAESSTTPSSNVQEQQVVQELPQQEPNAIPLEQVVTKDELFQYLDAMNAKFDAVVKENADLKDKLSSMQDKYENKDFGNAQKQGLIQSDKNANEQFNETFESYSKKFM